MPRAKKQPDLRMFVGYGFIDSVAVAPTEPPVPTMSEPVPPELPVPPMTPPTPPVFSTPVGNASGARIVVPALGPLQLDFALPVAQPADSRQVFNFTFGLFGAADNRANEPQMPEPVAPVLPAPLMIAPIKPAPAAPSIDFQNVIEFLVPLNDPLVTPPPPMMLGFWNGNEFTMGSGRAQRPLESNVQRSTGCGFGSYCAPTLPRLVAPPPAQPGAFVIGIGGIERPAPCGAPQFLKCDQMTWTLPTAPPVAAQRHLNVVQVIEFDHVKASPANALIGTWYREALGTVIAVTFAQDELKVCTTQSVDGQTATITITAHYTVTKDGLVYGAITGADASLKGEPSKAGDVPSSMDLAELAATMQAFVDAPFSFRTKMTSAGLMVSGLKCGGSLRHSEAESLGGMFKPAKNGIVPAPVALKTTVTVEDQLGSALGAAIGSATGRPMVGAMVGCPADKCVPPMASPEYQRLGVDFNIVVPAMGQPVVPGSVVIPPSAPPQMPQPVRPVGYGVPGDATKQLAAEAFGQLLQQSGIPRRVGDMPPPTPRYIDHFPQYFAPDSAFPLPRELASQEDPEGAARRAGGPVYGGPAPAPPCPPVVVCVPSVATGTSVATSAKSGFVGTWYRDAAGKQCVVKVSPDHLTLTVHEAQEEDGKVTTASLVITADYHMTRDGMTAVGLITSVDVSFEGDFPQEDSKSFFEMLGELRKALEDKPFALTFRAYGDALVIGNVRMPTVADHMDGQPAGYMAGRYKVAGDKLPKPKVVKITEPRAIPVPAGPPGAPAPVPPGFYAPTGTPGLVIPPGSAYPEYSPPPPAPNGDLLPPQKLPSPRVVPSGGSWAPTTPSMTEPTPPPVPQMQQPTPPGVSVNDEPKPTQAEKTRAKKTRAKNDWQQFWLGNHSSRLPPERIYGGIY